MKIKIKSSICIIVSVIVFILMGIFTYKVFGETAKNLADSAVKNTSLFWNIKKGETIDENGIENAASSTHWLCLSHEKVTGLGSVSRIDAIMDINVSKLGTYSTQVLSGAKSVTNEDCSRNKTIKRIAYHVWAASVDTSRGMVGDEGSSPSKNALYYFFNTTDLTKYIGDFTKKRTDSYLKTSKQHSGKVLDYAWTYADSETTGSSADITSSSGTGAEVNVSKSTNGNTYSYIGPFKITTAGTIASVTIKDGNSSPSVAGYANSIGGGVGNIKNLPRNGNAFYVVTTDLLTNTNVSVTINTSGTSGGGTVIDPRTGKSTIGYIKARIMFIGNNEGQATTIFRGDLIKGNPSSDTVTFTAKNNLGKMTIQKVGAYAGNENYENVRDFGFKLYYLEGTTKKYLRINDSDTISGKASVSIGGNTKYDADANTATTIFTSSNGTVSIDNISVEHQYYIEESNTDDTNYSADIINATTQIGTGEVTELETDGNIIWMDDNSGNSLKVLVESNGAKYLLGEYQDIPNADIYLNRMTLTVDGSIYPNLTEVMISPMNVTSLSQLTDSLGNKTNYEISTTVTVDSIDSSSFQEAENALYSGDHRISIKSTNTGLNEQLKIIRATSDEINLVSGIIGNIDGTSDEITIRIYNCTNQDLENIENNFNVLNVKTF